MGYQDQRRAMLIDDLCLLASAFDVQKSVLPDFVHVADEILHAVTDWHFEGMLEGGAINQHQLKALKVLDDYLDTIEVSENCEQALAQVASGEEFERARNLAKKVLLAFGESLHAPDLAGVTYVKHSR